MLQELVDSALPYGTLELPSNQELAGPVTIRSPLKLTGNGATVWALRGPVLLVESADVALSNLNIELTGDYRDGNGAGSCAIQVVSEASVLLDDVYVKGSIVGVPGEEGQWLYPGDIQLGEFRPGEELKRTFWVTVPVACHLSCDVADVQVAPNRLSPGVHEVVITIDNVREDTLLLGTILVSTALVKRRILIAGHALAAGKPNPSAIINSLENLEVPPGFLKPMREPTLFPGSAKFNLCNMAGIDKPEIAREIVARYAPWYAEVRETLTFDQKLRSDAYQSLLLQCRKASFVSGCCAAAAFIFLILGILVVSIGTGGKAAQGAVSISSAVVVSFIQRTFHNREDKYRADAAAMTANLEYGNQCLLAIQYIESVENPVEKLKHQAGLIAVLLKRLNPAKMSKRSASKAGR